MTADFQIMWFSPSLSSRCLLVWMKDIVHTSCVGWCDCFTFGCTVYFYLTSHLKSSPPLDFNEVPVRRLWSGKKCTVSESVVRALLHWKTWLLIVLWDPACLFRDCNYICCATLFLAFCGFQIFPWVAVCNWNEAVHFPHFISTVFECRLRNWNMFLTLS